MLKMFFINLFPAVLFSIAILWVNDNRRDNFKCGDSAPSYRPDDTAMFFFMSVLIVTYAIEILLWLGVGAHILVSSLRNSLRKRSPVDRSVFHHQPDHRLEMYIAGCLRFASVLFCGKKGGFDLKNAMELREIAVAAMEFANNETKMDIVLSDIVVGFKILARLQAEKRVKAAGKVASQFAETKDQDDLGGSFGMFDRRRSKFTYVFRFLSSQVLDGTDCIIVSNDRMG